MENDYCKRCGKCCDSVRADFKKRILYRDGLQHLSQEFESMLEIIEQEGQINICRCKYLKDNLCTNLNKPVECRNFPASPFAFLPEDCGYTGVIFIKNENVKRQVRKLKEEIIHYEALIPTLSNKFERNQLIKIIESHKSKINKFCAFGSEDW